MKAWRVSWIQGTTPLGFLYESRPHFALTVLKLTRRTTLKYIYIYLFGSGLIRLFQCFKTNHNLEGACCNNDWVLQEDATVTSYQIIRSILRFYYCQHHLFNAALMRRDWKASLSFCIRINSPWIRFVWSLYAAPRESRLSFPRAKAHRTSIDCRLWWPAVVALLSSRLWLLVQPRNRLHIFQYNHVWSEGNRHSCDSLGERGTIEVKSDAIRRCGTVTSSTPCYVNRGKDGHSVGDWTMTILCLLGETSLQAICRVDSLGKKLRWWKDLIIT